MGMVKLVTNLLLGKMSKQLCKQFSKIQQQPLLQYLHPCMEEPPKSFLGQQQHTEAQQLPTATTPTITREEIKESSLEEMLNQLAATTSSFIESTWTELKNQAALIHNLKVQMDQITNLLANRPQGSLSSNTKINPKEHVKAVGKREFTDGEVD